MSESLTGTIDRIVYQNEENGYTVARLIPDNENRNTSITIVGYLQNIKPGVTVKVTGHWKEHPRFGTQYQAENIQIVRPATRDGIVYYLGSGLIPGIGTGMAERIVNKFGDKTLEIMDEDIDELRKVAGKGRKKIKAIHDVWEALKGSRQVFLFLQDIGTTPITAQKIYKHYGNETEMLIRENPYRLANDIWGIGFVKADIVAKGMGFAEDSHFRIRAGLHHILSKAVGNGHVFMEKDKLLETSVSLLGIEPSLITYTMDDEINIQELICEDNRTYLPWIFYLERGLCDLIRKFKDYVFNADNSVDIMQCINKFEKQKGIQYHPQQREAIIRAAEEKFLIITGGPGTGKTTIVLGILHYARTTGKTVLLAAPTGRAAKRMEEITHHPAKTIHRLLEYQPGVGFQIDADRPLKCDMLVIDETSMVDLPLMYALVKAIPLHSSLILVGDEDQLPSVGPGQILKDLISSGKIETVKLTEIFRQAQKSRIVTSAHAIRQGIIPSLHTEKISDFYFLEENDPGKSSELICDLVINRLPQALNLNPVRDIQVLTPMYRGLCGAENLNRMLQARLHNQREDISKNGPSKIFINDKVMQIRNNYEKQVFNGDIGIVENINPEKGTLQIHYEGNFVEYKAKEKDELVLAYAITIHKSQGNEYPVVVIPMLTQHYIMLYRNLLYTAVTRARKYLVIVGSRKAIGLATRNVDPHHRNTYLKERLQQYA